MIDIDVTRELLPQTTFDVENFEKKITQTAGALTLVVEERLEVSAFYYQMKTTAVPGFRGEFRGEFRSLISDDIWEVSCWLKHIEPRAIYIEEENRCVDKFGEEARNPQIGPWYRLCRMWRLCGYRSRGRSTQLPSACRDEF